MTGTIHIVVAMKPLDGRFSENALKHGVAGLNVDGCRIRTSDNLVGGSGGLLSNVRDDKSYPDDNGYEPSNLGRWPANVIHDGSGGVVVGFPMTTSGAWRSVVNRPTCRKSKGDEKERTREDRDSDSGTAGRFFKQIRVVE